MGANSVFVVVHMPVGLRAAFGEGRLRDLVAAHPRAEVSLAAGPDEVAALLPRADAALIVPGVAPMLAPALRPGGRLRWVHSIPVGIEGLLTPEVRAAGHVALTATKGPMDPVVAEHALMLMLALARDLPGFLRSQAERRWGPPANARPLGDVWGKTALILGVGGVGSQLARMCRVGLGMRVLGLARTRRDDPHVDRYIERADLHAALGEADFVSLCLALTPQTAGIVDAAALAAMRPTAFLVNVARGGLVDECALVAALQAGRIAGAGLDTVAAEPLPAESPLWAMPHVVITPHIANGRSGSMDRAAAFMRENIGRFADGEPPLGAVDREAGY